MNNTLTIKLKVDELIKLDEHFNSLDTDYILKQDFTLLNEFMDKRNKIINELKELISNEPNLDLNVKEEIQFKVKKSTENTTLKCKSIQKEIKSRLLSSSKHKQAFQYFNNSNPVNPTFIDKTV